MQQPSADSSATVRQKKISFMGSEPGDLGSIPPPKTILDFRIFPVKGPPGTHSDTLLLLLLCTYMVCGAILLVRETPH